MLNSRTPLLLTDSLAPRLRRRALRESGKAASPKPVSQHEDSVSSRVPRKRAPRRYVKFSVCVLESESELERCCDVIYKCRFYTHTFTLCVCVVFGRCLSRTRIYCTRSARRFRAIFRARVIARPLIKCTLWVSCCCCVRKKVPRP